MKLKIHANSIRGKCNCHYGMIEDRSTSSRNIGTDTCIFDNDNKFENDENK